MGDRFEGHGIPRPFACVIRRVGNGPQLVVIDHPEAGTPATQTALQHVAVDATRYSADENPTQATRPRCSTWRWTRRGAAQTRTRREPLDLAALRREKPHGMQRRRAKTSTEQMFGESIETD